jgi:hypothetical protein
MHGAYSVKHESVIAKVVMPRCKMPQNILTSHLLLAVSVNASAESRKS